MKKMIIMAVVAVAVQQLAKYLGINSIEELKDLVTSNFLTK